MHFPAYRAALFGLSLAQSFSWVHAAPQQSNDTSSLKSNIESYLSTRGRNVTVPEAVYASPDTTNLTCGILNAYRDPDLVTPQDAEYASQAEQHWSVYFRLMLYGEHS